MVAISIEEHCKNAPKKEFVRDFLIAIATSNLTIAEDMLAENVILELVGDLCITEKQVVIQTLAKDNASRGIKQMTVRNILSHGNKCAAEGYMRYKDGSEVAFCHICTFTGHSKDAKIKYIATYLIEKKPA